jgi:predicted metal-dependent hydrolase
VIERTVREPKSYPQRLRSSWRVSRGALKVEAQAWADKIGVQLKEIHIRPMNRKWASCSTSGRVSFSEDLLAQRPKFRDEVIVHELLHLKVPNHGKLFKALLIAHLTRA